MSLEDLNVKKVLIKVVETANESSFVLIPDTVEQAVSVVKEMFAGTETGVSVVKMTGLECQMCYKQNEGTAMMSMGKYTFVLYFFMSLNTIFYSCHYSP